MDKRENRTFRMGCAVLACFMALYGCSLLSFDSEDPTIVGTWEGIVQMDSDPIEFDLLLVTFGGDGSFEALVSDLETGARLSGSSRGTYTFNDGTLSGIVTSIYDGTTWETLNPPAVQVAYLVFNATTLTYAVDMNQDETPDFVWTLYKQAES